MSLWKKSKCKQDIATDICQTEGIFFSYQLNTEIGLAINFDIVL